MFSVVVIIAFWIIYYIFSQTSIIPAGIRLTRADWLSFLGDYLSFAGTAIVSVIALWQTKHYNDLDEQRREEERMHSVQPIFSVNLSKFTFDCKEEFAAQTPQISVDIISIFHAGDYPVSHVIAFNEYQKHLMTKNSSFQLVIAFDDIANKLEAGKSITILTEDAFDRHEKHSTLPQYFNINYDDVDGRCMFQTFELKEYDGTIYYSLKETVET